MKRMIRSDVMVASSDGTARITVGDIYNLSSMFAMKAFIYDANSEEPICDGEYLKDVMRKYPQLADTQVIELSSRGSNYLSLRVAAEFDFDPAF